MIDIAGVYISIRALREEGDPASAASASSRVRFQSTPSARRATSKTFSGLTSTVISIHALRKEGDALLISSGP